MATNAFSCSCTVDALVINDMISIHECTQFVGEKSIWIITQIK